MNTLLPSPLILTRVRKYLKQWGENDGKKLKAYFVDTIIISRRIDPRFGVMKCGNKVFGS